MTDLQQFQWLQVAFDFAVCIWIVAASMPRSTTRRVWLTQSPRLWIARRLYRLGDWLKDRYAVTAVLDRAEGGE